MAKTLFREFGTVVTGKFLNAIFGQGADGGHKHDGKDEDGHCGLIDKSQISGDIKSGLAVTGQIIAYAGNTAPDGWLVCDGREVPADKQYDGFRVWIVNNASYLIDNNKYYTPNLSGRVIVGCGKGIDENGVESNFSNGETGGEYAHKLSAEEIAKHAHGSSFAQIYGEGDGYLLGLNSRNEHQTDTVFNALADVANSLWKKNADGGVTRDIGDGAHNNIQPYFVLNYIICAV